MTRKEQIEQESAINAAYIGGLEIAGDFSEEKLQTYQNGFINGADWADNNPKSPWISVKDDLPCNHDNLLESNYSIQTHKVLVAYNNGKYYGFARMNKIIGIWEWYDRSDDITHWMPIPKMTKEE